MPFVLSFRLLNFFFFGSVFVYLHAASQYIGFSPSWEGLLRRGQGYMIDQSRKGARRMQIRDGGDDLIAGDV